MAKRPQRAIPSLYPSRKTERRIKIPQPTWRPLAIRARDLVRTDYLRQEHDWFVTHRRGMTRPRVGVDPLEARAVSKEYIRGTLPERILYKALIVIMHMKPGADFDFQSSLQGGRVELGGIVADFIFPILRTVIQVQGPTHTGFLRHAKDEEQRLALEEMGYSVVELGMDVIYNEAWFENWLRRLFGLRASGGGSGVVRTPYGWSDDNIDWSEAHSLALQIRDGLRMVIA